MAHYYFGDKAGLLAAVVEQRVQPLALRVAARVGERLLAGIRAAQALGRIDPALDAPKVALSFLSLCVFPVITAPVSPVVLGVPVGRDDIAALAEHQFRVFLSGVGPKP